MGKHPTPNDDRSTIKNPNNDRYDKDQENRRQQQNSK